MKLPLFETVVQLSTTPAGQLERQGNQAVDPLYYRRYLYNQAGQPAGYCSSSLPTDPRRSVTCYEYDDNRLYRVYSKIYDALGTKDFFYSMQELVYTARQPASVSTYWLDLRKGTAVLKSIEDLTYDEQGHLSSIRDRRPGSAYPLFRWKNGNLKTREEFDGDGHSRGLVYTYTHDSRPNPLNDLALPYEDPQQLGVNTVTSINLRYSTSGVDYQTHFRLTYDAAGRLGSSNQVDSWPSALPNPVYRFLYK